MTEKQKQPAAPNSAAGPSSEPGSSSEEQLGRELVEAGLLSDVQLRTSIEYQASLGGKLQDIILKLGFVSARHLNELIAKRERVRSIDLSGMTVDRELMAQIPRKVIEKHEAVPLRHSDDTVLLALSESSDFHAIEDIQFLTSLKIETVLAPRSQILELIARYYDEHGEPEARPVRLEDRLIAGIADPSVQALARVLLRNGLVDAAEWRRELES